MTQWFVNPFFVGYFDGDTSVISLTSAPDTATFSIYEPEHPLRGVTDTLGLLQSIPRMGQDDVELLKESGIISEMPFDRERMVKDQLAANHDPEWLRLTIIPTLNCNFSCPYCGQRHCGQPAMGSSVYESVSRLISRKIGQGVRNVHIMLFGGEPLLLTRHWMPWLRQWRRHCAEAGVLFAAKATTNGYLLRDASVVDQVLDSGCTEFQITLDGVEAQHNLTRPSRRGGATHGAVVAALRNLALHPGMTSCTIRINHNRTTVTPFAVNAFLRDVVDITGKDDRFWIHHHRAADLGGTLSEELPYDEFAAIMPSLRRLTHDYGLKLMRDFYPGDRSCSASSRNSLVVMPDGGLAKCTAVLNDPRNHVGHLREDGEIEFNSEFEKWVNPTLAGHCESCVHLPQCRGGSCPLASISSKPNCPAKLLDFSYLALKECTGPHK